MKRWTVLIALLLALALGASAETATLNMTPAQFAEKLNAILDIFEAEHFKFPPPGEVEDDVVITIAFQSPVTLTAKMTATGEDAEIEQLMVQSLDGDTGMVRKLAVQCFAAATGISDREHVRLVPLAAYAPEEGLLQTRPFASHGGIELNFYTQEGDLVAVIAPSEAPIA